MRSMSALARIPCNFINCLASGIFIALFVSAALRRIFPFLSCRQAVAVRREVADDNLSAFTVARFQSFLLAPLVAVGNRVIPTYLLNRMVRTGKFARVLYHDTLILCLCYFRCRHIKIADIL